MSTLPFISQLKSLWQAATGDLAGAKKTQEDFLDAWEHHPVQQLGDLADNIPIVGHIKGFVHLAMGDTEAFAHSEEAATRTMAVLGAGALTAGTGGVALPILAGVVAGVAADAAITGVESARHHKYDPQGYLGAVSEMGSDWRSGVFDIVALGVGDAVLASDGAVTKSSSKTTKVFRVEGEGVFLNKRGVVEHGANSRLFPGPGGSVIESNNTLKLIVPPEDEEKPVKFKKPAVLYLNVGDAARAEAYYVQKFLQYQAAVEKMRDQASTSARITHPTAFQFKIKSFRVLTSDVTDMFRDVPHDGEPSPSEVRRVDPTMTQTSFQCPQPVYAPLIEKAIPNTFKEVQPSWLTRLPTRLLRLINDHQVAYGHVRTFVIVSSKFTKVSLAASIAENITPQELKRLNHGPLPLSSLSQEGIDSIEVRDEPVHRLRQSREVKCGRKVAGDVNHGRHMEYLAEFSDGSTFWIPSRNVANDLKVEFWNVVMKNGKDVAEVVSSESSTGQVTVKRADGSMDVVKQEQIFWQQEETPTLLSDAELDALLHHGHFGVNADHFVPCVININTDWAGVEILSDGAVIMKDPAADRSGEYTSVAVNPKKISFGSPHSYDFVSRSIPFFVSSSGSPFSIRVTHGRDADVRGDRRGSVILNILGRQLTSKVNTSDPDLNTTAFEIRPTIATPALLSITGTDWATFTSSCANTTIKPDLTVDQSIYEGVKFTATSFQAQIQDLSQKTVIPFVITTWSESVDFTLTAAKPGLDDYIIAGQDGEVKALFAHETYSLTNWNDAKQSFANCKVNARPPIIPL